MKSITQTLTKIYSALAFANVGNLRSLQEKLDQHVICESDNVSGARDSRSAMCNNVYHLHSSLPAR